MDRPCGSLNAMLRNMDSIQIVSPLTPSVSADFFNKKILKYLIYCLNLRIHFELGTAFEISKSIIVIHKNSLK